MARGWKGAKRTDMRQTIRRRMSNDDLAKGRDAKAEMVELAKAAVENRDAQKDK